MILSPRLAASGLVALVLACTALSPAYAQRTPVFQSGTLGASGNLAKFTSNGLIVDGSGLLGDVNGKGLNPFAITDALGLGMCANSAATGVAHSAFCFGHDASGNGLITLDSNGGLAAKTIYLRKNGTLYEFPFTMAGILGPVSSTSGNVATWDNGVGGLLKDSGVSLRPNAVATGFSLANQALFLAGTLTGSGAAPYAEIAVTDTAAGPIAGSPLSALRVDHSFGGAGAGAGARTAFQPSLIQTGTVSGTDNVFKYYTAAFPMMYGRANDGGTALAAAGHAYGLAAIAQLENGATFWYSVQGAEIDVSVQSGASVLYKSVLTLANVNSDAVKGSVYDAMLGFLSDGSAKFDYGIAFGRPGAGLWPIESATGTIIGVPVGSGAFAKYGIDFRQVTWAPTGHQIIGTGWGVDAFGNFFAGNGLFSGAGTSLELFDSASSHLGARWRYISLGGSTGTYEYQINTAAGSDFSTVVSAYAITGAGNIGFGQTVPLTKVDVNGTFRVLQASPAAAAACAAGQIVADTGFIYACASTGVWKRVAVTGGY